MSSKPQARLQDQKNLRKIFKDIHEGFRPDQLTLSL